MRTELSTDKYPVNEYTPATRAEARQNHIESSDSSLPQPNAVPEELTDAEIKDTVAKLNKTADIFELNVEYKIAEDETTKRQIIQVVNKDGKVITEIPPSRLKDVLSKIQENMLGVFIDKRI